MITLMNLDVTEDAISQYLDAHASGPVGLLREISEETAKRYEQHVDMCISADEAALLSLLVTMVSARTAVEVGVFTGSSSLAIASALPVDGKLIACDKDSETTAVARRYWERAGLADRIDLVLGPALDTLTAMSADLVIDFAFVDADKENYSSYYDELMRRLRVGGIVVLDNVLLGGKVLDASTEDPAAVAMRRLNDAIVADERVDSVMLPVRDGVTIVRKSRV